MKLKIIKDKTTNNPSNDVRESAAKNKYNAQMLDVINKKKDFLFLNATYVKIDMQTKEKYIADT